MYVCIWVYVSGRTAVDLHWLTPLFLPKIHSGRPWSPTNRPIMDFIKFLCLFINKLKLPRFFGKYQLCRASLPIFKLGFVLTLS